MKSRRTLLLVIIAILLVSCSSSTPEVTATAYPSPFPTVTGVPPDTLEVQLDKSIDLDNMQKNTPIILHFNQPMNADSTSQPLIIYPKISGKFVWNESFTTLTFTPNLNFRRNFYYRFYISSVLESDSGLRSASSLYWNFEVHDLPRIFSYSPSNKELDPQSMSFSLKFNRPMQVDSFSKSFSIQPEIHYTLDWEDNAAITITLLGDAVPGKAYIFELSNGMLDTQGNSLASTSWTYNVQQLKVDFKQVIGGTLKPSYDFNFNFPVDTDSVEQALSLNPNYPYKLDWNKDHTIATATLQAALEPGNSIEFSMLNSAQTPAGDTLTKDYSWESTMDSVVESIEIRPGNRVINPIVITFNYGIDPDSVADALVIVPYLDYELVWNNTGTRMTIIPDVTTLANTNFALSFSGQVMDVSGIELTFNDHFSFTTPPPLVSTLPEMNDWRVDPSEPFVIIFDRPMDQESTALALTIDPPMEGEISWESDIKLIFIPIDGYLLEDTDYEITITTDALDVDGNLVLGNDLVWTFNTRGRTNRAGFGEYGSNLQVVDAEGRRVVHYSIRSAAAGIRFELYRITLQQFIKNQPGAMRRYYQGIDELDFSGGTLVAAWNYDEEYTVDVKRSYYDDDVGEALIPEDVPSGLYVLNMITDHLDDQLLVVLTKNSISVKLAAKADGGGQITTWVNNVNGGVIPGANISIYDADGNRVKTGVTNKMGIFQGSLLPGNKPYIIVARHGNDISVSGLSGLWRSRSSSYGVWRSANTLNQYLAYLHTDRPIYRPGQTVFFKGVVRRDNDASYSLPFRDQEVTLNIRDARGNLLEIQEFTLNTFGTFNGEFQIAAGAMLGSYTLELRVGADTHQQVFKVQEYVKPDFQVNVQTDNTEYIAGQEIFVEVNVEYLLGEPVPNADIKARLYQLRQYRPYYYSDAEATLNDEAEYYWTPIGGSRATSSTDANGNAVFTFDAIESDPYYSDYRRGYYVGTFAIEVTADDGSHQPVSSFTMVRTYTSAVQMEVDTGGFLHDPDQIFTISAQISSVFDDPVDEIEITMEVEKHVKWSSYDRIETRIESTNANGLAMFPIELSEQGYYRLTFTGTDSLGNKYELSRWVYIYDFRGTWLLDYSSEINLSSEENTYLPGDTARFLLESSFSGQALITVERGSVLEERIIPIQTGINIFTLPITAEYSPNIFVFVQAWETLDTSFEGLEYAYEAIPDNLLRLDAIMLTVPDDSDMLTVTMQADREVYQPRDEATYEIQVTDQNGDPVSAELSLALVDEAIFLLADDPSGDIHAAFNRLRGLGVYASDTFAPWRLMYFPEYGGGGGGGGDNVGTPRSDFPDTVVWLPEVRTGSDGWVTVTVTLPDTLTSWRLTAKAITLDSKVGQGQINVVTKLPLVVRPLPPLNLVAGDSFIFSAIVHNFSDSPQAIVARVTSAEVEWQSDSQQMIRLEPGEHKVIGWQATANQAGEASFIIEVSTFLYSDSVALMIPIKPLAIPTFETDSGIFQGEYSTLLEIPGDALPMSNVHVEVSGSISGSLLNGLEYLTGYPYGCVEQVMSAALPNAVVARAFQQLELSDRFVNADLDAKIQASIQRLYALQHEDGGWGWWWDDETDDYQTAWVVFGLALIGDAGYTVDDMVIERGVNWLNKNLEEMDIRTQVYALYAMAIAGHGNLEAAQIRISAVEKIDAFSQAALALTYFILEDQDSANAVLAVIEESAISDDLECFHWQGESKDGYYRKKTMSSTIRSTALVLEALVKIDPDSDLIPGTVDWLMSKRKNLGWGTTNETSYAILALTDYILATQTARYGATVSIFLDGELIAEETLGEGNISLSLDIPIGELGGSLSDLRIVSDRDASLYYLVSSQMYVGEISIEGEGLSVTRRYLDPETKKVIKNLEPGQLVLVELTVELTEIGFYLLLEDHLPGGLEAVNENLNTTSREVIAGQSEWDYDERSLFRWESLGYNYKEIRSDRVSFFFTSLRAGKHKITYLARAVTAGEFTALPAEFSAMYDPKFWGRSGSTKLVIILPEEPQ